MEIWVVLYKTKRARLWRFMEAYRHEAEAIAHKERQQDRWPHMQFRVAPFTEAPHA
jgi:hypothetical protein